ncbi:uncharacterized protein [Diabrotica undecimpunctata]|uniref:uncharacterized protein n=1 Tax=Diabrotica undecimpunctata TaxID=50387 RepID=UPI003B6384A7
MLTIMSTSSQNNGKKSSASSIVNTPSSTPITNLANGSSTQGTAHSSPPPNSNAPKYGTLVPNRIFVGGISANTTEGELMQLFSNYGTVKAAKIIQDRAGVSKGYGFITFESEDDAKRPLREAENIVLRERKLNIAPAIKKQPFSRAFDASSPPAVAANNASQFFFPPGAAVPYFQSGVTYYTQPAPAAPGDPTPQQPVYQPPPMYPTQTGPPQPATYPSMMFPAQTIYMPQQYPMPIPYEYNFYQGNGPSLPTQYLAGGQSGSGSSHCTSLPSSNSPPRPNGYGQQVPTYNSGDPVYYNLPIYGATLEGPPLYADAFDLSASGTYAEETYSSMITTLTQENVEASLGSSINSTHAASDNFTQHLDQSLVESDSSIVNVGGKPPLHKSSETIVSALSQPQEDRNSHTPIVSLLSIDHQQEKDYSSMQSGRRRKILVQSNQNNVPMYPTNGYVNQFVGYNPQQPPPHSFGQPLFNNGYGFSEYRRFNGYPDIRSINNSNKPRRRIYENRRSNDHSSRSSLRTDSNSSASCVDENKNEEKTFRTTVNTPPPAPYSPMTNQQFKFINYSNTKNIYNHKYANNNNYYNRTATHHDRFKHTEPLANKNNYSSIYPLTNNFLTNSHTQSNSDSLPSQNSQVHVTTTGQSFVPVTIQAQTKRNKRSLRRSGASAGGINEIGAGDAPLPGEECEDVYKKLETLKL